MVGALTTPFALTRACQGTHPVGPRREIVQGSRHLGLHRSRDRAARVSVNVV